MPTLKPQVQKALDDLHECRENLLSIKKADLNGRELSEWIKRSDNIFKRSDTVTHNHLWLYVRKEVEGYEDVSDVDVCLNIRESIISHIDEHINILASTQSIKPVLDGLILNVPDDKLATLLREFNQCRDEQPNISSIGFRTILPLIIRERAKLIDPNSKLATKDDIGFEQDILLAIKHDALFNEAEKKLLKRYLNGGDKDIFDNVAHKPNFLIMKEELEDAVNLLNRLLPTIINS